VMKDGKPQTVEETDSIRSGVTVPYSPEFADLESNTTLMKRLADLTGGNVYEESDQQLAAGAEARTGVRKTPTVAQSPQPVWVWLLLFSGCAFLMDVAARRIAIAPAELADLGQRTWERLRGREVKPQGDVFLERLKSRKSEVSETLERARVARRYEA